VSPSATDPSKLVPPIFALPSPIPQANAVNAAFLQKDRRSTVVEDVEKGIVIEDVNTCASPIGAAMGHKRMPVNIIGEQNIPRADNSNI
jgi:hypothetical protein